MWVAAAAQMLAHAHPKQCLQAGTKNRRLSSVQPHSLWCCLCHKREQHFSCFKLVLRRDCCGVAAVGALRLHASCEAAGLPLDAYIVQPHIALQAQYVHMSGGTVSQLHNNCQFGPCGC